MHFAVAMYMKSVTEHLSFLIESSEMHGIVMPGRILDILTFNDLFDDTDHLVFILYI